MKFSKSDANVLYLHNYYPVRFKEHSGVSGKILKFKKGEVGAVNFFAEEMSAAMDEFYDGHMDFLSDMLVCVVPSHEKGKYSPGLVVLAKRICSKYGMKNAVHLIKRTKTREKIALGGKRDMTGMLDSLAMSEDVDIKGKNIIVLDDVTTTGNSMWAVRKLLKAGGARYVIPQALGKTRVGTLKNADYCRFNLTL